MDLDFSKLDDLASIINDFSLEKEQVILNNKNYIKLSKIEYKYWDLLTNAKTYNDYVGIKKAIYEDIGENKVVLNYFYLICKERIVLGMYISLKKETFLKKFKIKVLIQLFIATLRYGEKIFKKPSFLAIDEDAVITNYRLYMIMVNPFYLYKHLGILDFSQSQVLKRLIEVNIDWNVEKTFDYLLIKTNNSYYLKIFNLEKEIIKRCWERNTDQMHEYGILVYHTYMKLLINFLSENIIKYLS